MGLIKSTNMPTTLSPFSMRDVENHAKGMLLRAQQQAEALLAQAQQEAAGLKEAAYGEGFVGGRRAGLEQGKKEGHDAGKAAALEEQRAALAAAVGALNAAMTELDASRRTLETDALQDVIELAAAIARRVTKRQAILQPQVLVNNLNEAMKLVVGASDLRVAIHPDQRATLDEALPKLRVEWPALQHAAIVDDSSLHPGGCRIFTRQGRVDADIDGQLDRVIGDLLPEKTTGESAAGGLSASIPLSTEDTGGQAANGTPANSSPSRVEARA